MKTNQLLGLVIILLILNGCGSLTGIPGHGGGKRFAVEQELVAAATRATIKKIDLSTIRGKKVNLFINAIGDKGTGNLQGGRLSLVSQIRGDYVQTPATTEKATYPRYTSKTTSRTITSGSTKSDSTTSSNSTSSTTSSKTESTLASPDWKQTSQEGSGSQAQLGLEYKGLGAYKGSEEITSNDIQYLSGLLQTYLFLKGVHVVPPSEAEVDVYVTVDVFGTVRTRVEWFLANNEILRAKTAIEILAVEKNSGSLVMPPQSASVEAEYNEQYMLWVGPITIKKILKKSNPLLSDFTNLKTTASDKQTLSEQDGAIPYPFRHQIEKMMEDE